MFVDNCQLCKNAIYSDEEKVSDDFYNYHLECAQDSGIEDEELTQ